MESVTKQKVEQSNITNNQNEKGLSNMDKIKQRLDSVFPQELRDQARWCNWRSVERDGRQTKLPLISSTGGQARSNDEDTWSDYETAKGRISSEIGMGYFLKEPYIGIDLDDVGEDIKRFQDGNHEDNIVSEFIHAFGSYSEISPSGNGIHIIIKGELPEGGKRRGQVEMYNGGRFFTMTGNTLGGYDEIVDDSAFNNIIPLHEKYIKSHDNQPDSNFDTSSYKETEHDSHNLSDEVIITRAMKSKQGQKIKNLLEGNWDVYDEYPSQSEADMAFANMLAFWTAKDKVQMDRIFRDSGLMRAKWDEMRGHDTYGSIVLDKAIVGTNNVYTINQRPKAKHHLGDDFTEETLEDVGVFPLRSADDTGNAERFVDRFGDIAKFNYIDDRFYIYNGKVWEMDRMGKVEILIDETVNAIEDEVWEIDDNIADEEAKEKAQKKMDKSKGKHINRSRSRHAKNNMRESSKHRIPVLPDDFDVDEHLLNTQDGYVDLTDGSLHPSDKDRMFSMITDSKMSKAKPKLWLDFLDTIFEGDQEMVNFIQRAMGYTLTGSVKEQVMFILYGKGQNGKSKLIETLRDILGGYTNNIQASTLGIRNDNVINNDIAKLQGSRMVTSSESNDGFRFDEGLVKQLTGGDTITARFLYGEEFNFRPQFKLWLSTNHRPIIKGTDDGIWRRIVLIPFSYRIPEEDRDLDFGEKLLAESDEILNWAIEGAVEWEKNGLQIPTKIADVKEKYREDMDVVDQFLMDEAKVGEELENKAGDLFQRYKEWAEYTANPLMSKNVFGTKMKEKFDTKRKSDGIYYNGLQLKPKEYQTF